MPIDIGISRHIFWITVAPAQLVAAGFHKTTHIFADRARMGRTKGGKRKSRNQRPSHAAKRARTDAEPPARYFVDGATGLLRVAPYRYAFETYVKQRWIGRRLLRTKVQ